MISVDGILLITVAAIALAGQSIFIRLGTNEGSSNHALVVVLLVNIVLLVPYMLVSAYPSYELTVRSALSFAAAGLVGTMLGRAFFYAGIARIGASRAEPIKATMPLYSALFAILVLGESLNYGHLAGILLIIVGVGVLSRETQNVPTINSDGIPLVGLSLPLAGAVLYGIEPIFAKIGFAEGTPIIVGLAVKTLAATAGFVSYLRWQNALPSPSTVLSEDAKWYIAAGIANTTFLLSYYAALSVAPVVLVVPIMQTSPLFVIGFSFVFLQRLEQVSRRLAMASMIVVAGAIMVTLYS